jgi:hypothetical protein
VDVTQGEYNNLLNNALIGIPVSGYPTCNYYAPPYGVWNNALVTVGGTSTITTTLNGAITSGATSLIASSGTGFPTSGTFRVKIDGEVMIIGSVTGGTAWSSITRGDEGTTAASHSNGATITWIANYAAYNSTILQGGNTSCNGETYYANSDYYSPYINLTGTGPGWVNVGNTSTGSESSQPVGANFALSNGSALIGAGVTQTYLAQPGAIPTDIGACSHLLTTCP